MTEIGNAAVAAATRCWVEKLVVGENLCPFAGRELSRDKIRFAVCDVTDAEPALQALIGECVRLDAHAELETTLLIFSAGFADFDNYLDLLAVAEALLVEQGYEGRYQLASFHPAYVFADADSDDAANYTNRSPYPMLHLLREASIARAIKQHVDAEGIPQRNIRHARALGRNALEGILRQCGEVTKEQQ